MTFDDAIDLTGSKPWCTDNGPPPPPLETSSFPEYYPSPSGGLGGFVSGDNGENGNGPNNDVGTCLSQAASNGRGLALAADIVGDVATGVAIANPASNVAILIGVAATSVGTLNALVHNPGWSTLGITGANQTVVAAGTMTHALELGSFIQAGTSFAKGLSNAVVFGAVVSSATDASAAISAYTNCRNGKQ